MASAADSRDPAVVRARKDASWARVKGSEEEEEGAGADDEEEEEDADDEEEVDELEGAQEVDDEREDAVTDDKGVQASALPYMPPFAPPRPRESAEGRRCVALLLDAKRCCAGAGAGEQGLGAEGATTEEEATEAPAAEAAAERALADAGEGDGEAPRRGSGEPAALAATLVDLGERAGALPRESGATRAGAAATCASTAEGAAAAPQQRKGIDYQRSQRPRGMEPEFGGLFVLLWGCKAMGPRERPASELERGKSAQIPRDCSRGTEKVVNSKSLTKSFGPKLLPSFGSFRPGAHHFFLSFLLFFSYTFK